MSNLKSRIEEYETQLEVAKIFAVKFNAKLPEGLASLTINNNSVMLSVLLEHVEDSDRDRALTVLGDVFGRGGWEAQITYNGRAFNWIKHVDGVQIYLFSAQKLGTPERFPVDPTNFPLQIEEN